MDIPLVRFLHFDKEVFSQHTNCIPRVGETVTTANGEKKASWQVLDIEYVYSFRPGIGYTAPSVIIKVTSSENAWPEDVTISPDRVRHLK